MARFIREIMNPEVFTVTMDVRAEDVLDALLDYGISAAPVVDEGRRPVGVTSVRDLVRSDLGSHVSSPALTIEVGATVEHAANVMARSGRHHLVVVGGDGCVAGMVSSLDLLQALVGFPVQHPATFPHRDPKLGVTFSDPKPVDRTYVKTAPARSGVLVFSVGGKDAVERDVWVEEAPVMAARLTELYQVGRGEAAKQDVDPKLAELLSSSNGDLRVRWAEIADAAERKRVARRIRAVIVGAPRFDRSLVPDMPKG